MEFLTALWLPILLSAVFVFVVSSILHMAIPHHKADHKGLPGEANVLAAMRAESVPPGDYMFPFCNSMKEMGSEEMLAKFEQGPVGFMTVYSGPPAIGKSLLQWFLYSLLISVFAAYLTNLAHAPGTDAMAVFRTSGTVAVLAYATASIPNSIWKNLAWGTTMRFVFDGILYGLATGAAFGWLWPGQA